MGRSTPLPAALLLATVARGALSLEGDMEPSILACHGAQTDIGECPGTQTCRATDNCELGNWGDWQRPTAADVCSGLCFRSRGIRQPGSRVGIACAGPTKVSKPCTEDEHLTATCAGNPSSGVLAPRDCEWGDWTEWGPCSLDSKHGEAKRSRHIKSDARGGGKLCPPLVHEELAACHDVRCIDGVWGAWEEWQACSSTCGGGLQARIRRVAIAPNECGRPLVGSEHHFRPCGRHNGPARHEPEHPGCPRDAATGICALNDWSEWGTCACCTYCGLGQRKRTRGLLIKNLVTSLEQDVAALELRGKELTDENEALHDEVAALRAAQATDPARTGAKALTATALQAAQRDMRMLERENRALWRNLTALRRRGTEVGAGASAEDTPWSTTGMARGTALLLCLGCAAVVCQRLDVLRLARSRLVSETQAGLCTDARDVVHTVLESSSPPGTPTTRSPPASPAAGRGP